jgi:hypothetical protein
MTATRHTTPDPRTEPSWLAGLPLVVLQSLRDVVAENIADAARLAARGELEDSDLDAMAGEFACLNIVGAEIMSRRPWPTDRDDAFIAETRATAARAGLNVPERLAYVAAETERHDAERNES